MTAYNKLFFGFRYTLPTKPVVEFCGITYLSLCSLTLGLELIDRGCWEVLKNCIDQHVT